MLKNLRHFFANHRLISLVILSLIIFAALRVGRFYSVADIVVSLTASICGLRIAWDIYQDYKIRRLSPDIISLLAAVMALVLHLPLVALVVVSVVLIRKVAYDWVHLSAKSGIGHLTRNGIKSVTLLRGRKEIEIPLSEVKRGFKILVRADDMFPVDGTNPDGEEIISGAIAEEDTILRVTADAESSQRHQLIKILRTSVRSGSPFATLSEKFVIVFMVMSLAVAGAVWYFGGNSERALAVLAVAAPTPLVLAAPLAILGGLSKSATMGVYLRNGKSLELLATTKTFVTNKGTKIDVSNTNTEYLEPKTSPGDNVRFVESYSKRPLAFVGSTSEDSPYMTAADLGVSLNQRIANIDAAGVFILSNNPSLVKIGVKNAKHALSIAALAILCGVTLSVALQVVASTGFLSPIASAGLQLLVDLSAVLVTLRAQTYKK